MEEEVNSVLRNLQTKQSKIKRDYAGDKIVFIKKE